MIIVEGPDGSGKTTLVKRLVDRLGLPVSPRVVGHDTQAMTDLKVWTELNVAHGFQPMIFDRHRLISELIYGSVVRSNPEPPFNDWEWLTTQLKGFYAARPVIIYCLPPLEQVKLNLEDDPLNVAVAAHTERIYSLYTSRFSLDSALHTDRTLLWDYTNPQENLKLNLLSTIIDGALTQEGI